MMWVQVDCGKFFFQFIFQQLIKLKMHKNDIFTMMFA